MAQDNQVDQNYHKECEMLVNKQINLDLYAFYTYTSLGYYFDRDDVAICLYECHIQKYFLTNCM